MPLSLGGLSICWPLSAPIHDEPEAYIVACTPWVLSLSGADPVAFAIVFIAQEGASTDDTFGSIAAQTVGVEGVAGVLISTQN